MAFATLVLAGMPDGSGMTTQAAHNIQGSSVITKHAGRAFGAIATANVAVRNGLLHFVLGPHVCPDSHVRGLDASAAIPRTELCSVNEFQMVVCWFALDLPALPQSVVSLLPPPNFCPASKVGPANILALGLPGSWIMLTTPCGLRQGARVLGL